MPTTKLTLPADLDMAEFLSVHAHDLRSPFNHIIGFGKMLLNTIGDEPLADFQKEDLGTIYRSGLRAYLLVNGLIDAARLKRGEKSLSPAEVDIQRAFETALAQWKKFNPTSGTEVEARFEAVSAGLRADEQVLPQVLFGFLAYVALFIEPGGKLTFTLREEAECFLLGFTSHGRKAAHLSELDLQLLGYVNRKFIELHGGEIRRAEENDEGALVHVSLPKQGQA
ncbi:MAG: HAMP domain-containing sensor histidine kinase [Anaerolineales bacterium]